ncbi:nucleoside recognition membrane protein YjiH [Salirhabdus euzebyi]|uniref:Nucleoside recognition membrane protein YjiH n=1 Tax=Salirhabdus euzebyi TaxID=394506 RepID=A0A841Q697_9BACI|nr:YjiH family protein [Salirhabdus euzebyi]MBB6453884.1 nucleoside recognition membrane protein YjiH [Salirhabdus euzebyi]
MKDKIFSLDNQLKFIIPSLIGIIFFIVPIPYNGEITIPIAILSSWLQGILANQLTAIMTIIITGTAILTLVAKFLHHSPIDVFRKPSFVNNLLNVSWFWVIVRVFGAVFALLTFFQIGPEAIYSEYTGGLLLGSLLHVLFAVFLFAGMLLPLLLNFGLLELFGTLLQKVMRPLFTLPGRSSIDNLASWLGDGTIGVLLTSKQYEQGYYTKREAAVIGTTFSVVSITFSLVIINEVGLGHMFVPFYLTVLAAGIIAALIMPRIPPLSRIKDTYLDEKQDKITEEIPAEHNTFSWGYRLAVKRASKSDGIGTFFREGSQNVLDMWMGVAPVVMAFGTVALVLAEYTPIFQWLGVPFIPLLELMQLPEAQQASETILIGFADMFLPAILISTAESELTRFVIACLSVSQLIYMSEVGGLILGSKIPVNLGHLFMIFLLRTIITLPIIVLIAHFIF